MKLRLTCLVAVAFAAAGLAARQTSPAGTASIAGRVLDDRGAPVAAVQVVAMRVATIAGDRRPTGWRQIVRTTSTGTYTVTGLDAGDYAVIASLQYRTYALRPGTTAQLPTAIAVGPPGGGADGAMALSMSGLPQLSAGESPNQLVVYRPAVYPKATDLAGAEIVSLATGQARAGVDFQLVAAPGRKVSGTIGGPVGAVENALLYLFPGRSIPNAAEWTASARSVAGGAFLFAGVPNGAYTLVARRSVGTDRGTLDPEGLWLSMPLTLGDRDLVDLKVTLRPGVTVSGRFVADRSGPAGAAFGQMDIGLESTVTLPADGEAPRGVNHTDPSGQFSITGVQAGTFFVRPSPARGWSTASVMWRGSDVSKVPLGIRDQNVSDVVVTLTAAPMPVPSQQGPPLGGTLPPGMLPPGMPPARGSIAPLPPQGTSSISGTLTDADGKPLAGVEIHTMVSLLRNGTRQALNSGQWVMTDAQGQFHLTGRGPGEYLVVALAHNQDPGGRLGGARSVLPPPVVTPDGGKVAYVTTYFPGVAASAKASLITLGDGEDRAHADFQMQRQPVADVIGTLVQQSGGGPTMSILVLNPTVDDLGGFNVTRGSSAADGHFVFPDVPIGEYVLNAGGTAWARVAVTVRASANPPLTVTVQTPFTVTGRVEFKGDAPPPTDLSQVTVQAQPEVMTSGAIMQRAPLSATGEFTLRNVPGGSPYVLRATGPSPWIQVSGVVGGKDTLDFAIEFTANMSGALVTFVDRQTQVVAAVRDAAGQQARDCVVIVYDADRALWSGRSRRVRVLPAAMGAVTVSGLPAGKYLAVAGRDFTTDQVITPAFLESLVARSTPFDLTPGERKTVELRVK